MHMQSCLLSAGILAALALSAPAVAGKFDQSAAAIRAKGLVDGHAPGVLGRDLDAYFVTGISNNHEIATPEELELHRLIAAAPSKNWQFHASDLCKLIGQAAYDAQVLDVVQRFRCQRFAATLAVHGRAVQNGQITR